jgi:predicted metal-binding membrane protein
MSGSRSRPPAVGSPLAAEALSFYLPATLLFLGGLAATVHFTRSMSCDMTMPGGGTMSMMWMRSPGRSWPESAAEFLLMWLAMMVAMMLPSALPMLWRFHPDRRAAGAAAGYFAVWLAAGLPVYAAGVGWSSAAMRWSAVGRAGPALTGAMLVLAGVLQLTPWKSAGLARCRDGGRCAGAERGGGVSSGFAEGIRQGLSCAVCSAGPMLALMAVGMMSTLAMTVAAVLIAFEKIAPHPGPVTRASGYLLLLAGAGALLRPLL